MHVVGHQAVGPDFDARVARRIGQQVEIKLVVIIFKESPLASIATLGHVMRDSSQNQASEAGHTVGLV